MPRRVMPAGTRSGGARADRAGRGTPFAQWPGMFRWLRLAWLVVALGTGPVACGGAGPVDGESLEISAETGAEAHEGLSVQAVPGGYLLVWTEDVDGTAQRFTCLVDGSGRVLAGPGTCDAATKSTATGASAPSGRSGDDARSGDPGDVFGSALQYVGGSSPDPIPARGSKPPP